MLSSCTAIKSAYFNYSDMNKVELGMPKDQVVKILGNSYTIAEKRIEDDNKIEVLSYSNYTETDVFYMFVFKNDKLEKWYREFAHKEIIKNN